MPDLTGPNSLFDPNSPAPNTAPAPTTRNSAEQQLLEQLIRMGTTPIDYDSTGAPIYDPAFGAMGQAYNAVKGAPDRFTPIPLGEGRVMVFDPRTGESRIDERGVKNTPPAVVSPGQGVLNPATGKYEVAVPLRDPNAKTAEQIAADVEQSQAAAAASRASATRSNAEVANMESPEQAAARRMAEIRATAQAQSQAAIDAAKAKVASGLEMTESDKLDLQNKLAGILAQTQSDIAQAGKEADYRREQPQRDITNTQNQAQIDVANRNAATAEANASTNAAQAESTRINNERTAQFQRDQGQAQVLTAQASQGQQMLDRVVKAGVGPSMSSLKMAVDPLRQAFQIMQGMTRDGSVTPEQLPTPMAPRPAGPTPLSVPAPAPQPGGNY